MPGELTPRRDRCWGSSSTGPRPGGTCSRRSSGACRGSGTSPPATSTASCAPSRTGGSSPPAAPGPRPPPLHHHGGGQEGVQAVDRAGARSRADPQPPAHHAVVRSPSRSPTPWRSSCLEPDRCTSNDCGTTTASLPPTSTPAPSSPSASPTRRPSSRGSTTSRANRHRHRRRREPPPPSPMAWVRT